MFVYAGMQHIKDSHSGDEQNETQKIRPGQSKWDDKFHWWILVVHMKSERTHDEHKLGKMVTIALKSQTTKLVRKVIISSEKDMAFFT